MTHGTTVQPVTPPTRVSLSQLGMRGPRPHMLLPGPLAWRPALGVALWPSCACHRMTNSQGKGPQYPSCTRGLHPTIDSQGRGPRTRVACVVAGCSLGPSPLGYFSRVVGRFRCHGSGDVDGLDWSVASTPLIPPTRRSIPALALRSLGGSEHYPCCSWAAGCVVALAWRAARYLWIGFAPSRGCCPPVASRAVGADSVLSVGWPLPCHGSALRLLEADSVAFGYKYLLSPSPSLSLPLQQGPSPPLPDDGWKLSVVAGLQLLYMDDRCSCGCAVSPTVALLQ